MKHFYIARLLMGMLLCLLSGYGLAQGQGLDIDDVGNYMGETNDGAEDDDDRDGDPNDYETARGVPYYPVLDNSTNDIDEWKLYIMSWMQDPPSTLWVNILANAPNLVARSYITLKVTIGYHDGAGNLMPYDMRIIEDIEIENGYNRVPIQIHQRKGDIVSAKIIAARNILTTKTLD